MLKVPFRCSVLATAAVLSVLIVPAAQAAPPTVHVRVEGATRTLVDRTVTLSGDPTPAPGTCPADSVAAALEAATGGDWDRAVFTNTIAGETHDYSANDYWAEWVNDGYGSGVCTDTVQDGDRVLMLVDVIDGASNSTAFPMTITGVPATVAPGAPFTVTVTQYGPDGAFSPGSSVPSPAAGVTVAGGGASAVTGADGRATLTLTGAGPVALRGSRTTTRTAPVATCVTTGDDGECGTVKPPPPCETDGADGLCGSPDRRPALGAIAGLREQERFARGKGPRTLAGTTSVTGAGVQRVEARLTRRLPGRRCSAWDAARERFAAGRCGADRGPWFTVGTGATWSYLLPAALPTGRYVLDTRTTDTAGNVDATLQRGRNRIVFHVG